MGSKIRFLRLTISTRNARADYDLTDSVTVVTGSIGVGKSSLLELLKYGLGGSAKLMPAIRKNVTSVEMDVAFSESRYILRREMGENTVDVLDVNSGEIIGPWAVTNRKYMPKASQQLLSLLGLPAELRIPKKRVQPTGETVGLSFFDLYRYIYLSQNGIDSNVVGHIDRNLDNKRRAVFELLYRLNSPELIDLAVRRGEWMDRASQRKSNADVVKDFLEQSGDPEPERLTSMAANCANELDATREMLDSVRRSSSAVLDSQQALRANVTVLREQLDEALAARDASRADALKSESLLAQLRLEEQALQRASVSRRTLSGLDFAVCPRCLQSVRDRAGELAHCLLCLQPEPITTGNETGELKRLQAQLAETQSLLDGDRKALDANNAEIHSLETRLAEATLELERTSSALISPRLEEVQSLSMRMARLEAQLEYFDAVASRWANYREALDYAQEAATEAVNVASLEQRLQESLIDNQSKIDALSETYDSIVEELRLPWYESAQIDNSTYLPMVNGEHFDELSVGGARKTIANLAYHLANLEYALDDDDLLYPTLLVVDSPRKNVGQTRDDAAVGVEIYRHIASLKEARGGDFQLIIADNDIPSDMAGEFNVIHLTYENPLVPGIGHPGESVDTVG